MRTIRLARMTSNSFLLLGFLLKILQSGECKMCIKREEIGNREGNHYTCDDPDLTQCCERNNTFTCCQSAWRKSALEITWLLLIAVVILIMMCIIVHCLTGQSEFFRSPTIQEVASSWKKKCRNLFDCIGGTCDKVGERQVGSSFSNLIKDKSALMSSQFGIMDEVYLATKT